MKIKSNAVAAMRLEAETAAMSWLLGGRTHEELAGLADRLRMAIRVMVGNQDLQPELSALMGPKGEALPDCIVTLYLREVPYFKLADLRAHLCQFAEPIEVDQWLRFMGISRLKDQDPVPRPRIFPRRLLATDMANNPVKTAATSATTYNRCLQLLALLGLIREAQANNLGALDTQVTLALLELVEREIAATPLSKATRHPRDIRPNGSEYVHRIVGAFAMVVMLGSFDPSLADEFAACPDMMDSTVCQTQSDAWMAALTGPAEWQAPEKWQVALAMTATPESSGSQDLSGCPDPTFDAGCLAAPYIDFGSYSLDVMNSGQFQLAALDDVILGSRRLLGPQPSPQPVEPLQRSYLVPFVEFGMP